MSCQEINSQIWPVQTFLSQCYPDHLWEDTSRNYPLSLPVLLETEAFPEWITLYCKVNCLQNKFKMWRYLFAVWEKIFGKTDLYFLHRNYLKSQRPNLWPTEQWVSQPVTRPASQPVSQLACQPVGKPSVSCPGSQLASQLVGQPAMVINITCFNNFLLLFISHHISVN